LTSTQSKGRRPNEPGSRQQKGDPAQATRQASGCLHPCGTTGTGQPRRLPPKGRKNTPEQHNVTPRHAVTMARMDRLFGVTMVEQAVSQLASANLKRAEALVA
jgi:hypothetical protein